MAILAPIFKDYFYWGKEFESFPFYDYSNSISQINHNNRDLLFDKYHLSQLYKV